MAILTTDQTISNRRWEEKLDNPGFMKIDKQLQLDIYNKHSLTNILYFQVCVLERVLFSSVFNSPYNPLLFTLQFISYSMPACIIVCLQGSWLIPL